MIVEAVREFLASNDVRGPIVAAVSGGPDSTALLLALAEQSELTIVAAHINHHLRDAESDGDEAFVRDLSHRLGVPMHVADGSLDPESIRRQGIEAAAREVRHARLQEIRAAVHASHVATAHQKNDQAETLLMRLMTGSGLAGLRAIHPIRDDGVIRPLLEVTREDIDAFLRERGVTARIDRSNSDPRFLRNRIRALLAQFDPQVIENLASVARQARVQWAVMERLLDVVDSGVGSATQTRFPSFPDDPWLRQALLHRHIRRLDSSVRDVSAADLRRLAAQLGSLERVSVTRNLELLRRHGEWILRRRPQPAEPFEIELRAGYRASTPQSGATLAVIPRRPDGEESPARTKSPARRGSLAALGMTRQTIQLPPNADPLFTIRSRRDGDRFQPLGMQRQKKLKDFLIDRKIAAEVRDRLPLLVWRGSIVCVGGVEISEAFKITGGGELYEITIETTNPEGLQ